MFKWMEIKILTPQDAEAYYILRLEALLNSPDSFATLYEDALDSPIEKTRANLASDHAVTFGAFADGKLIGNMTLIRQSIPKMRHKATIVAVYVSPAHRRKGIADRLMEELLAYAARWEGIEQLDLMVASENLPARNLYLRFGFEHYGTEVRAMKSGDRFIDEDLMVKFLN